MTVVLSCARSESCLVCPMPKTPLVLALMCSLLSSCAASKYGKVGWKNAPQILNVSSYDPKERQRKGRGYTPLDQAALKANGSLGLIARCGKGLVDDSKCADFLVGAERQGSLLGAYYYVKPHINIEKQAEHFVKRLAAIKRTKDLKTRKVLLVGDIDTKCSSSDIVRFINRTKELTGVTPVIYLENSAPLIARLAASPERDKQVIRKAPYWLALYSNTNEANPHIKTPQDLTDAYDIWDTWALWQYGGVLWENRRSAPKVYRHDEWMPPRYFGNIDRPMERNAFNGSLKGLYAFWDKHSWAW